MVGTDQHKGKYKQDPFWPYLKREELKPEFPIKPLVEPVHRQTGLRRFEIIQGYLIDGRWRPFPIFVDPPKHYEANVRARWFAWAAMHGDEGWSPTEPTEPLNPPAPASDGASEEPSR